MEKFIKVIIFVYFLIMVGCTLSVNTEETNNIKLSEVKDFFEEHILYVQLLAPLSIKIKSDGKIISSEGKSEFILSVGNIFTAKPDRHSSTEYVLTGISKGMITVDYTAMFDHRSFGKDLVSIDRGKFEASLSE